jgi:hypothetical protein
MLGFIGLWIVCAGISSLLGANPVLSTIVSGVALIASLGGTILFWRWWERDPRGHTVDAAGLRGPSGVWPYGGGAVAVGFRDPETVSTPPPVPEGDPHRTNAPGWAALPARLVPDMAEMPGRRGVGNDNAD